MQAQITAEREKRALIAKSEGERQQEINIADGERQAAILKSEGEKQGAINRAEGEATAITTMWLAFALGSTSESTAKATAFARKAAKGKTTEWLVARTLLEKKLGEPGAHEEFLRELLSRQNPDGGWSPMPETASDGFATGLALYAVTEAGPADDAVVRRARKFLVESQTPDGSWTIPPASWTKTASTPERIQKLDPIYVEFTIAENDLTSVQRSMAKAPLWDCCHK